MKNKRASYSTAPRPGKRKSIRLSDRGNAAHSWSKLSGKLCEEKSCCVSWKAILLPGKRIIRS